MNSKSIIRWKGHSSKERMSLQMRIFVVSYDFLKTFLYELHKILSVKNWNMELFSIFILMLGKVKVGGAKSYGF